MSAARLIVIPLLALGLGVTACAKLAMTADSSAPGTAGAGGSSAGFGQMGQSSQDGRFGASGGAMRPSPRDYATMAELKDIYFDFDRAEIRPDAVTVLDANAAWLKANPRASILIEGHTDERGTSEYNLALGDRRARAARNYLISQGVLAGRIALISYGEARGACAEPTEHCWGLNRRAHFAVRSR